MNPIIENNIDKLKALCIKYKVDKMYVFGSVLTPDFNQKSDIDFLVRLKPFGHKGAFLNYFDFKDSLKELFKREVDLVSEEGLENPYIIKSINKTKQLIYG
ncbi:nucleotidyltransferase family protein [Galbibacter pacificus]|uniref:Nucleotidyltransferase domain-containing protein n=1 Tax=Galbibacter pacificus TaxID=2996052 RepID=A0ABT6FQS5_9FLAO|nr:nucleotidyltransferase domain-containing protein [Galbibacter pacificus]MDG3582110.1 nucleotidyltransferase domain-containing protein [Galbibacter pacificus]MDG3585414.1 nucleotidyltransferase domain-containing protein [Galbibacter pacificus]